MQRYEIHWADFAALGAAAGLAVLPELLGAHLPYAHCAPCDASGLWSLDRQSIGVVRERPARVSDALAVVTVFGAGGFVLDSRPNGVGGAEWEDLTVLAQTLAVGAAAAGVAKVVFHRPRPPRYTARAADYPGPFYGRSFPSEHATVAFAAAAAYASMMDRRGLAGQHGGEIVLLFGTATATSVFRVVSHKHFPTDVLAGALLGTAIGWTGPRLHHLR